MQSDFAVTIDKRPIKNFWRGRGGFLPIAIVERMIQGSIEDAEQYFNGRSPEGVFAVSAHYGIARDGRVWQFVADEDTAWSNGVLQNPDLSIDWLKEVYQEKVNCNLVTLSIDYEGYSGEPLTPRQYESALALHRQLIERWEIEVDRQHIIGHNWIDSLERSHNPGPLFPFNQLIKDLKAAPEEAEPAQPAPNNPLTFLETPLAGAEPEVDSAPSTGPENVAAYQPETAEEPAYRPQVEAFTFTPDLNEEIDQVTDGPTEVDSATAEPEQVQAETFQDTAAYQPEEIDQDTGYQPEEVQQETPYEPETFQTASQAEEEQFANQIDAAYQPEVIENEVAAEPVPVESEAYSQTQEVENEATTLPESDSLYLATQDAFYASVVVEPETPYESEPVSGEMTAGTDVVANEAAAHTEPVEEPAIAPETVEAEYPPEEVQTASEPEEPYQAEEVQSAPATQVGEALAEEIPAEGAQPLDQTEESQPEAAYQPEEVQPEASVQEPSYEPDEVQVEAFQPEQAGTADQSDVAYEFEELERDAANLPIQGEEITKPGAVQTAEDQPETASQPEEVQAADQSANQSEIAYETEAVHPDEAQPEPAQSAEQTVVPEIQTEDAYQSEFAQEPLQNEAAPQVEAFDVDDDVDDIEADLAYITKDARSAVTKPLVMPVPASQPASQPEVETEAAQPVELSAAVTTEESQPEAAFQPEEVQPEPSSDEAQAEAVEPEAVEAEPAFEAADQPDNQPEVQDELFDAPGQPEHLAQLETAIFEAAEPATTEQTEPAQVNSEQGVADVTEEVVPTLAGSEIELTAAAELASQEGEAAEQVAPELSAPETVAQEPAGHAQDDWATDIFANDFIPGLDNAAPPVSQEPSTRNENAVTGQLEVSPAIGDDITPRYFRPEFFDPTHSSEPTPVESPDSSGLVEASAPDQVMESTEGIETAPAEIEPSALVEEEAATTVPESQSETPEPLSEEASAGELAEEAATETPGNDIAPTLASEEEILAQEVPYQTPTKKVSSPVETVAQSAETVAEPFNPTEAVEVETASNEAARVETPEVVSSQTEVPAQPVPVAEPTTQDEPEKPEEKHHWYDGIKKLFGGHDEKQTQATPDAIPAQSAPPPESIQATPFNQVESVAPETVEVALPLETRPAPDAEAPQVNTTKPEVYHPDYAAEQEIFRSESDAAPGTIEAATQAASAPALFDAGTNAAAEVISAPEPAEANQPETEVSQEDYSAEQVQPDAETAPFAAPDTFEDAAVTGEPAVQAAGPEVQPESAVEDTSEPEQSEVVHEAPVNPPVELPKVEESFYPFELDTPGVSNYDNYYRSGTTNELVSQSSNYDFGLESPASTYSQDYAASGPSDYPFELPTQETPPSYLQSFAPAALPLDEPAAPKGATVTPQPAQSAELSQALEEPQPAEPSAFEPLQTTGLDQPEEAAQPVIPPFSFEPERPGDVLFETNSPSSEHPKFAYDDLELPDWLNEPETSETATNPPANFGTGATSFQEPGAPPAADFAWASGSASQENTLPGWLQESKEESGVPEWLQDVTEPVEPAQPASQQTAQPAQSGPTPAFKDNPAREIPNKDWQDNENLFEDDDFFSLLNQSGLDLSLERGGTGALPSTGALPTNAAPSPTPQAAPPPAAPVQAAPSSSPEPEFDNFFDEVAPPLPPAKMTVRQLIDRNDGYTAPLSYEDLDMSVPFGLEEDETLSGLPSSPAPANPPVPADPPGFNRIALGGGQTSVELANIRSAPSYDKNTVVRVSEQGERFEFDGWMEGPELRGSTRWYHIAPSSGDHWIHSSLVQLDRPFRG